MKGWKAGHSVVVLLVLLFGITYLDRICISVAGPRIQEELHIGPVGWGWVTGVFTISYCLFEIPSGMLADRIGPRRVLTRIVLWWSTFTALTGAVTGFYPLLVTRFLFGAGEAGAFPSAAVVISRWFPASPPGHHERRHSDGQPDRRGPRAAVGCSDPNPIWMAGVVLRIWCIGNLLGGCLVYMVPRLATGPCRAVAGANVA